MACKRKNFSDKTRNAFCEFRKPLERNLKSGKGSITMEAMIALPVFFCVIVAIAFLLRAVQVQERVQHAISQAALEIAGVSYIYGVSGALDIQRDAEAVVIKNVERAEDSILKSAQFDGSLPDNLSNEIGKQFDSAAAFFVDSVNGALFSQYAKYVTQKYLGGGEGAPEGEDIMRGLNIDGGGQGLDFMRSSYLTNEREDVKVSVKYSFNIPIPVKPLSKLVISQDAYARAWLYGAGSNTMPEDPYKDEEDIWALSNFQRGDRIREIFHANLAHNFNGMASFSNGTATVIHSLDTTAASYQNPAGIGKKIDEYLQEIQGHKNQKEPFKGGGVTIMPEEISSWRFVLVIPRNDISPEVSGEIDRCINDALAQGVYLQVERYATKRVEGEKEGEEDGLMQEVVD